MRSGLGFLGFCLLVLGLIGSAPKGAAFKNLIELSDGSFDLVVKNGEENAFVVLFYTTWCRNCDRMNNAFKNLARQNSEKYKVAKIDW